MKHITIILSAITLITASCHKKTSTPAPVVVNNTTAPANVTNAIDSAAVARHYRIDEYAGTFTEIGDPPTPDAQPLSFFVGYVSQSLTIFKSSTSVQVGDVPYKGSGIATQINDTVVFTGKGSYQVWTVNFRFSGVEIGDSLNVIWIYYNNNYFPDAERYCHFQGVRIK